MRRVVCGTLTLVLILLVAGTCGVTSAEDGADAGPRKIMEQYCGGCHPFWRHNWVLSRFKTMVIKYECGGCHQKLPVGGMFRVSSERETPEGWDLTITRMSLYYKFSIPEAKKQALIKYLADEQGLAPEEAAPYRYLLERRENYVEHPPNRRLHYMCATCHSFGRVALTRRDSEEWLKNINFHQGQIPTLEYQSQARMVEWWKIATTELKDELGKRYPLETKAWSAWCKHKAPDLAGTWRVAGHEPGAGDYRGSLTVTNDGRDHYQVHWALNYANGASLNGAGPAILYTGYEWRAGVTLGGKPVRQVLAVSADGDSMTGRWFYRDTDEVGGDLSATRARGKAARVIAVQPSSLRIGAETKLAIVGLNLTGEVRLGDGVKIVRIVSSGPDESVVMARADENARDGARDVAVGAATGKSMLVVYRKLDSVRVEPDYALARVGGNGGPLAPVVAQFEAVGYFKGAHGETRVGVVPATWSVRPYDDIAAQLEDAKFAGRMDAETGLFVPAGAGPNPKRHYGTNNFGNLTVEAAVDQDHQPLHGTAHLIVSAQRWVDPPLR